MPWKETCAMLERRRFVEESLSLKQPFSDLCCLYGISPKTGYKWRKRHCLDPEQGLEDRRKLRVFHSSFDEEIIAAVVDLRNKHPNWGPEKLVARLQTLDPDRLWPSPSTVKIWLRRRGLSRPRRKRRACPVQRQTIALRPMEEPNSVWTIDFKGWFYTGDRRMCEPLTLMDGYSRFLLACEIVPNRRCGSVKAILERAFARYGLPRAIRSDNGAPFGSSGLGSLTPLSVWLLGKGVFPEKIRAGHPEENSRHERFHRTLKEETARPPAQNRRRQQERFDRFRRFYNHQRPHGALGQTVPAEHYRRAQHKPLLPSVRPKPGNLHRVTSKGYLRVSSRQIYLTESLAGRQVGVTEQEDGLWSLDFLGYPLGEISEGHLEP